MKTNMSRRQKAGHAVKNTPYVIHYLEKQLSPPPLFFKQTRYLIPLAISGH